MTRLLLCLLFTCVTLRADLPWVFTGTTNVAATEAAFTNAYYTLPDNYIIHIGAGSFTLNTALSQSRAASISVQGNGTNSTHITLPNVSVPWEVTGTGSLYLFFGDMDLIGAANNSFGGLLVGKNVPASIPFPAFTEVARLSMTNILSRGLSLGYGGGSGWVHDCYFSYPTGASGYNGIVIGGNEYSSWALANPLGTTNMVVVDDCIFNNQSGNAGNGHFDMYDGASGSFRHCTFIADSNTGTHGYDSQVTSTRTLEVINCIFTNLLGATIPLETRGGVLTTVSNQFYGTLGTNAAMYLNYYRACWGSYGGFTGFQGYQKTNLYAGIALSATAGSLTATNVPGSTIGQLSWYTAEFTGVSRSITITGGTGSGQTKTITSSTLTSQSVPGTVTYNISGSFSPVPDATSTFEVGYQNGSIESVGNQPNYTFTSGALGSVVRQVKVGANLAESISNLVSCINLDPAGAGTRYSSITTNSATGRNFDFLVTSFNSTNLVLTNILDGTGVLAYPGSQQEGVLTVPQYTNTPVTLYPCISMANTLNGTNIGYQLRWTASSCTGPEFNTNSVVEGRNYYNTNSLPYTLLAYPYPGQSNSIPGTGFPVVVVGKVNLRGAVSLRVGP